MKHLSFLALLLFLACSSSENIPNVLEGEEKLLLGADLSYVNQMVDCGAIYHSNGSEVDPFSFFASNGCNLVRVRLWHNPTWTAYSNYADAARTIRKAKDLGMKVLLDFHYSDTWAHPGKQIVPQAWSTIDDHVTLGDSLYNYTYQTLTKLKAHSLLPDIVQIGNEINSEILMKEETSGPINWKRNSYLLNKGLEAIGDFNRNHSEVTITSMLHIAQPENASWFFKEAEENGCTVLTGLDYPTIHNGQQFLWIN